MNSTNVPSNSNLREKQEFSNPSAHFGMTVPNEKGNMKMPPEMTSNGTSERAIKIADTIGEVLVTSVGDCRVTENNTMELKDGTVKKMKNPNAYKTIEDDREKRNAMKEKAKQNQAEAEAR